MYVLLPISIVAALVFVWQGSIQNFHPYTVAKTVEGATQTIAQGPVASQEAIKQLGTNGGGFFNANSAHPFESPNPFTNLLQILLIFVLGAGLTYTFGHMVKDTRQGWALFWAMAVMFLMGVFVAYPAEQAGNPMLAKLGIETRGDGDAVGRQHGRQGDAVRHRRVGAVRDGDDRRQLRRRQQHARQLSRRSAGSCRCSTCRPTR